MAKLMQVEEITDVKDLQKPQEFKARYETDAQGRKTLVVSATAETITRPDGTKDVIMHVPTLDLVNKFKEPDGNK